MSNIDKALELLRSKDLNENIEVADLLGNKFKSFQEVVYNALGKGLPKSIPSTALKALIAAAKEKGDATLLKQLEYIFKNAKSTDTFKESIMEEYGF